MPFFKWELVILQLNRFRDVPYEKLDMPYGMTQDGIVTALCISSALMKVAAISTELDSDDVSDDVLDVALYEAICNIRAGQRDFGKRGGIEYDWDNHPRMAVAVRWCQENGMTL